MRRRLNTLLIGASLTLCLVPMASAHKMHHHGMMVAYDAKDKRFYSVAYAKAHGMHDRGGDPLTIVAMSSLPKEAKMSRAMHGKM